MAGVPASVISAIFSPAAIRSALESLTCGSPAPAECICLICRRREKAPGSMVVLSRDARTGRRSDLAA